MYIMIVSRGYPTEKYKMNGIFEFDQARALVKAGHKVVYAAVDVRSIRRWRKWGIENKKIGGVEIYAINIPCGRIPKGILQEIKIIGLNYLYEKILQEQGKPDVMHAHFTSAGYTASKLKTRDNLPFVMTEHFSLIMKSPIDRGLYWLAENAYSSADALITVSPRLQTVIKKTFNKESLLIPNIVDTELFTCAPYKSDGIFRFVSVGNLIARKRMDLTIEAFAKAFDGNRKVTLTIFGDGEEKRKIDGIIRKHNLDNRIQLMGLESRKNISEYLRKCDCFVLASQAETFGVVYIEALASGLPVIATRCGGPESFVDKDNGILVPVDDVKSLSKAMRNMYDNINKYDRKEIAKKTKSLFSPETVISKLERIYQDVIAN